MAFMPNGLLSLRSQRVETTGVRAMARHMVGPSSARPATVTAPQIDPLEAPATTSKRSPRRHSSAITANWKAPRQPQPGRERARMAASRIRRPRRRRSHAFASARATRSAVTLGRRQC
jgi:hypothetical protein